ncbi:MAG: thioredoxin family protein [Bacilli bacterium]|nr:thioredoxin family protein [Bacilli bacterium]
MEKNKKIFLGIGIGILVVGLLIATMFIGEKEETQTQTGTNIDAETIVANAQAESDSITESQMKELPTINVTTYLDYYNGSETRIVLVGRPTCPYSSIAEPIIKKIAKDYNLDISYLNTDEFSDDDKVSFVKHNEMFNEGYGTPLLLVVSNGNVEASLSGLTDTEHFIQFFKAYGLIQE